MKHLVALIVLLTVASAANAAIVFTEDFSGGLGAWSGQDVGQVISGGALQDLDDNYETVMSAALSSSVSSGIMTLDFDIRSSAAWARANAALVDASGKGVFINLYLGDNYAGGQMGLTTDGGASNTGTSGSDLLCNITRGASLHYEINLDNGQIWASADGGALTLKNTVNLAGIGPITTLAFQTHKKLASLDNIVVTGDIPEPASMALLAMGGLGMLIRRRR